MSQTGPYLSGLHPDPLVTIGEARAALPRAQQRRPLSWLDEPLQAGATPHEPAERLAA